MQQLPQNQDRELDWNEEIDATEKDFITLELGDYKFTVTNIEKVRYTPGPESKITACNKAIIHLRIDVPEGQVNLKSNLYLHTKCMPLLAQFFKSIGQRQSGETIKMDWNKVVGYSGMCRIKHRIYNGKTYPDVDKFLEPKEGTQPAHTSQPIQAPIMQQTPQPQQGSFFPQQTQPQQQPGEDVPF